MHDLRQSEGCKLLSQDFDKGFSATTLLIPSLELITFCLGSVSSHRADIDHAVSELNECTSHSGEAFKLTDVLEDELSQLLVVLFTDIFQERGRGKRLAKSICGETVLGEAEIEKRSDGCRRCAELFLLFYKITAADLV